MSIDDTEIFQVNIQQEYPLFRGVSIPMTQTLLISNPIGNPEYQQLLDWGYNSVYLRWMWGGPTGPDPDEYCNDNQGPNPDTGAGFSQININYMKTQINYARSHGIYPWIGMQDGYSHSCPGGSTIGWPDPYKSAFVNSNTRPNHCQTGIQTPVEGRDRYLNMLEYLCKQFEPDVCIIPWDFPFHMNGVKPTEAEHIQFYAQQNVEGYDGTQALMIKRIRETDAVTWPGYPPRYLGISPITQGEGYDSQGWNIATGELENWQPFYADGYPFYGEHIWYGFNSHGGGYSHIGHPQWTYPSMWGAIVKNKDAATGEITRWNYNMTHYDIMWSGLPTFQAAHPTAKFVCWEWIGLGIHYIVGSGGCYVHDDCPGIGDRPIFPSRINWAHTHMIRAKLYGANYMFFDWWGLRNPGTHPLSCSSPTEGGGTGEEPAQSNGVTNEMGWLMRYHNTLTEEGGGYQWTDGTWHTLQQVAEQSVPYDEDNWVYDPDRP